MQGDRPSGDGTAVAWDLVLVAGGALLTDAAVLLPVLRDSPLRAVLGLTLALFLPGYALVAALFPETAGDGALDPAERVGLAAGASLVASMVLGLVGGAVLGLGTVPVLGSLSVVTLVACGVAGVRRGSSHPDDVVDDRIAGSWTAVRGRLSEVWSWPDGRSRRGVVLDVAIAVMLVTAIVGIVYLVAVPKPHVGYTELYLLSEDTAGPDATEYPRSLSPGESASVVVGVENHRISADEYAAVVALQRVDSGPGNGSNASTADGTGGVTVLEEREVDTYRRRLAPGDRWTVEPSFSSEESGQYRLVVRLYRDGRGGTPVHAVHLWIDVGDGANRTTGEGRANGVLEPDPVGDPP